MSRTSNDFASLRSAIEGPVISRGDAAYDEAREALVWNGRKPERFPDALVRPKSVHDVAEVVRFANKNALRIGVRSGGHSWTAAFMRNGGILLDMSDFDQHSIDKEAMTATVGPGCKGARLIKLLGEQGLFFPGGHSETVGIGGYLLQGGLGWHSRRLGPACASIRSAQVVTASGEIVRADTENAADLFWALRGAGSGFFGVVTEFELNLYERPRVIRQTSQSYTLHHAQDVLLWAANQMSALSPDVECLVLVKKDEQTGELGVCLDAVAISYTEEAAELALRIVDNCPMRAKAYAAFHNQPVGFESLYAGSDGMYPQGMRFAMDNAWSNANPEDLMPGIMTLIGTMPPSSSGHLIFQPWGRPTKLPDMAYSLEGDLLLVVSSAWNDPAEDALHQDWVTQSMKRLERHAIGIRIGDENLASRPARFMPEANFSRLQEIRETWDPKNVFHSYLTDIQG